MNAQETNPKFLPLLEAAKDFTDEETTQIVKMLLDSHRLVINPQIIVQVQKLADPKDTFEQHVKESK